jgi:hypothetical protein
MIHQPATPADVRELCCVGYAKLAIEHIDRFGDAVPVELIEVADVCLDYAKHIRTMAECLRMDMLEEML